MNPKETKNPIKNIIVSALILIVAFALLFLFVPNQEKYYLESDISSFVATSKLRFVYYAIFAVIVLILFKRLKINRNSSKKKILNFLVGLGIFSLLFFFVFDKIFIGFGLYINRQFPKETVEKSYQIAAVTNQTLLAQNTEDDRDIILKKDYEKITGSNDLSKLKENEILVLKFEKVCLELILSTADKIY
ncbi:MAG: hypothetical protein WBA59_06795 [Moheibacter sp.]